MKIRSWQDFRALVHTGIHSVPFPILFQSLLARLAIPYQEARFLDRHGVVQEKPRAFPLALGDLLFPPKREIPLPQPFGALHSCKVQGSCLEATNEGGRLRLEFLAEDLLRLRVTRSPVFPEPFSYAVEKTVWPPVAVSWNEGEDHWRFASNRLLCLLAKSDGSLSLFRDGRLLLQQKGSLCWQEEACRTQFALPEGAEIYGLGERAGWLPRRGRRWTFWNHDPVNYDLGDDPLYSGIPFWLQMQGGEACGCFLDNACRSELDIGQEDPDSLKILLEGGEFRLYVLAAPTPREILARYAELTGRMPLPPLWALGFHQSRWSYDSAAEVQRIAGEFRRREIPCDAIHLDIDALDGWRCFTWNRKRFPDPPGLLAGLTEEGFHAVSVIDPGIKAERGYAVNDQGVAKGYFCRLPDGSLYRRPSWPGWSHFPDFTNPAVRHWWGELYREMLDDGVAGFENDMNEPSDLANGDPPPFLHHDREGEPSDHRACHNIYGLQMARATFEGLQRLRLNQRPFLLARSTSAGGQRFGATWTGDNQSSFQHLRLSLAMVLSLGLSGFSFAGCDVGGFSRSCWGELLARWTQLAAFFPFFRNHCAKGNSSQEPWAFGEPYQGVCRQAIELRYQLLPTLYTAFHQCSRSGLPILRPLFFDWPEVAKIEEEQSQFLFGDSLMAAPVLEEGATERQVYLPPGTWYDYWTGHVLSGEQRLRVPTPLEAIPLYARAGSAIPCWPLQQFIREAHPQELRFRIYAG
ncbi:MAG: TIM-barrel domain-containing protein, partial [bacterium]